VVLRVTTSDALGDVQRQTSFMGGVVGSNQVVAQRNQVGVCKGTKGLFAHSPIQLVRLCWDLRPLQCQGRNSTRLAWH
jgi:hypothetical protein